MQNIPINSNIKDWFVIIHCTINQSIADKKKLFTKKQLFTNINAIFLHTVSNYKLNYDANFSTKLKIKINVNS